MSTKTFVLRFKFIIKTCWKDCYNFSFGRDSSSLDSRVARESIDGIKVQVKQGAIIRIRKMQKVRFFILRINDSFNCL